MVQKTYQYANGGKVIKDHLANGGPVFHRRNPTVGENLDEIQRRLRREAQARVAEPVKRGIDYIKGKIYPEGSKAQREKELKKLEEGY
jgi:hypothetical protein